MLTLTCMVHFLSTWTSIRVELEHPMVSSYSTAMVWMLMWMKISWHSISSVVFWISTFLQVQVLLQLWISIPNWLVNLHLYPSGHFVSNNFDLLEIADYNRQLMVQFLHQHDCVFRGKASLLLMWMMRFYVLLLIGWGNVLCRVSSMQVAILEHWWPEICCWEL